MVLQTDMEDSSFRYDYSSFPFITSKIAAALARHTHALVPPIHITACDNIVRLFELAA